MLLIFTDLVLYFPENDDSDKDVEEIASIKSDSDLDETKTNIKKGKTKKVKLTKNVRFSFLGSFPYLKNINLNNRNAS